MPASVRTEGQQLALWCDTTNTNKQTKRGDIVMKRWCPFILALLTGCYAKAAPIQILIPSNGVITGIPGQTIGWGFTITNDSTYLVITGSQFCSNESVTPFCYMPSPSLGTFKDFTGSQFVLVGPAPESISVRQLFDDLALTGIGSFTIDSEAAPGSAVAGIIELTYDLFSVSPNSESFNPLTDTISDGSFLSAAAEVDVISAVSEPKSLSLVLLGSGLLAVRRVMINRDNPRPGRETPPG
jgi:hypothetical protein